MGHRSHKHSSASASGKHAHREDRSRGREDEEGRRHRHHHHSKKRKHERERERESDHSDLDVHDEKKHSVDATDVDVPVAAAVHGAVEVERDSWMIGPGDAEPRRIERERERDRDRGAYEDGTSDPFGDILDVIASSNNTIDKPRAEEKEKEERKKEKMKEKEQVSSERELNPYFKGGGGGLPPPAARAVSWREKLQNRRAGGAEAVPVPRIESATESKEREYVGHYSSAQQQKRMIAPVFADAMEWKREPEPEPLPQQQPEPRTVKSAPEQPTLPTPAPTATPTPTAAPVLTTAEINKMTAKMMKAQMTGNTALYEKLKSKIEQAKAKSTAASSKSASGGEGEGDAERVIMLAEFDSNGRARVSLSMDPGAEQNKRRKRKKFDGVKDGKRERFYEDDDDLDLKALVERERQSGSASYDDNLAQNIARGGRWVEQTYGDENPPSDEEYDPERFEKDARVSTEKQMKREHDRRVREHHRLERIHQSCQYCPGNRDRFASHLMIAAGSYAYLSLPPKVRLAPGHCVICPIDHVRSCVEADETTWEEIRNFMKCLHRMYDAKGMDVIFMENVRDLQAHRHTVVDCIPVSRDVGSDSVIYFQKAIVESDEEWSQHRKLIDVEKRGGLRRSVPANFAYFCVLFGAAGPGFAHAIEDERQFSLHFGYEVLGGLLGVDPPVWTRPPRRSDYEDKGATKAFAAAYKPFDWTPMLKE